MRCLLIFAAALTLVLAQGGWLSNLRQWFQQHNKQDFVIDYVHNYRFEDHDNQKGHHLLVAISDVRGERQCHLIEVANSWDNLLENDDKAEKITEEIYHMIHSHNLPETVMSRDQLRQTYGDTDALRECANHRIFLATYTPSASITG